MSKQDSQANYLVLRLIKSNRGSWRSVSLVFYWLEGAQIFSIAVALVIVAFVIALMYLIRYTDI